MLIKTNLRNNVILTFILILTIINTIFLFLFYPFKLNGISMEPTYEEGTIIFVNKINKQIKRNDIIVFYYFGHKIVKRVIGIENDVIDINDSKLYVNNAFKYSLEKDVYNEKTYYINENEYFVIGDNINNSHDSRNFGVVKNYDIIGKVIK